jgi:putative ABC transport system permease protein
VGADVSLDVRVLAFSLLLAVATTMIFALLPAWRASRVDLTEYLKAGGRGAVRGGQSWARILIAIEMAVSFSLLAGAGLFLSSALRMGSEHLGFNPDGVVAVRLSLPASRYPTGPKRLDAYERLLRRMPAVALASKLPPEAGGNQSLEIQGRRLSAAEVHDVGADAVSPGFFDTLQIPLRRGRAFTAQDRENSLPVVIINEALAAKYFPDSDPLGQQLRLRGGAMPWMTVIGVVGNLKHTELMNEMAWVESPILYRPMTQEPRPFVQVAVRGPAATLAEVQRQIAAIDPSIPTSDAGPLRSRLTKILAYPRFRAAVFGLFAFTTLLLSAVGLHGVLSQLVARRTAEFGLRRAVGAQTHDLLFLIARQGGAPVLAGLGAGVALTMVFRRVLGNLLYGIQPADPVALGMVSILLLTVAVIAMAVPAVRAASVVPMAALRHE